MDYSKFGNKENTNIMKEILELIHKNEDLAIEYMDNLLGIVLSKIIFKENINLLMHSIIHGREKIAMNIIDKNIVDLNYRDNIGENAFLVAVRRGQYNIAIKIIDTKLCKLDQKNNEGNEAIEYIKFVNGVKADPHKEKKLELLIKLLYYYIENNITITEPFQSTIDFICSTPDLLEELNETFEKNKNLKINKNKFKQYIRLDKRNILCAEPVAAEAGDLIHNLEIVSNVGSMRKTRDLKAKVINEKNPAIALPDSEDNFDENEYDSEEEEEFRIRTRSYSAGKSKSKKNKRKGKTRKLR